MEYLATPLTKVFFPFILKIQVRSVCCVIVNKKYNHESVSPNYFQNDECAMTNSIVVSQTIENCKERGGLQQQIQSTADNYVSEKVKLIWTARG